MSVPAFLCVWKVAGEWAAQGWRNQGSRAQGAALHIVQPATQGFSKFLRNLRFRLVGGIKQAYSKWHYRPERLEYYFLIWHVCITGDGNRIQHTDTLTTLD